MAAVLSDPGHVMHRKMTESPSCQTALPHKSPGIDVDTAAAFQKGALAATAVKRAQESRPAGTKVVVHEKMTMKSESIIGQSSQDTWNEIPTIFGLFRCLEETRGYQNRRVRDGQDIRKDQDRSFRDCPGDM